MSVKEYTDPFGKSKLKIPFSDRLKWQKQLDLNGVKTSALRRWLVSLGLIALEQTTCFTGGHDLLILSLPFGFAKTEITINTTRNPKIIKRLGRILESSGNSSKISLLLI